MVDKSYRNGVCGRKGRGKYVREGGRERERERETDRQTDRDREGKNRNTGQRDKGGGGRERERETETETETDRETDRERERAESLFCKDFSLRSDEIQHLVFDKLLMRQRQRDIQGGR